MSFDDYLKYFDTSDLVHVNLNAMYNAKAANVFNLKWGSKIFESGWVIGKTSGGCGNGDPRSYWINPQFPIMFEGIKNSSNEISVVVSLTQTESTRLRTETNGQFNNAFEGIAFRIYAIKEGAKPSSSVYDQSMLTEVSKIDIYQRTREVNTDFSLSNFF